MKRFATILIAAAAAGTGAPAWAQTTGTAAARAAAEQRYQIGQMERILEGAVEHGVTIVRDRLPWACGIVVRHHASPTDWLYRSGRNDDLVVRMMAVWSNRGGSQLAKNFVEVLQRHATIEKG